MHGAADHPVWGDSKKEEQDGELRESDGDGKNKSCTDRSLFNIEMLATVTHPRRLLRVLTCQKCGLKSDNRISHM